MPVLGVVQGLLPIVGYNYGANQHDRVSESIALAMKVATSIAVLTFIVMMLFPGVIILIFTNDAAVIEIGQNALRTVFILSFTVGIQMITSVVFQALGNAKAALLLSLSRQVLFLIPLLMILPILFKLPGLWMAFPLSDLLSFLLALWYVKKYKSVFFITLSDCNAAGSI